jgi:hypothetical protein
MGTTYTGQRVQDTYQSIIKIGDSSNLTGTAKLLSDGFGNDTALYLSTTSLGIGVTPTFQFQTSGSAKIGSNLTVGGNLTVNGTTTIVDSTVVAIGDNMMELAKDNLANTMDIGWYGTINSSGEKYVGMFYDASSGVATPTFAIGLGTSEPSSTATWTTKGKLIIGALDATTGVFSGQVTIPATPVSNTDAASKGYVDAQITAQDLDIAGDSGTGAIDLDSQTFTIAGGTNVTTSVSGQTVTINASGDVDGSGTANDVVMWQDSNTLTDAPIAISGNNSTFAGNVDITGNLKVDSDIEIQAASGYGFMEIGGPSGGHIDLKKPFSDDYDLRLITGTESEITASGTLKLNAGNTLTLTLDGSTQAATFAGEVKANYFKAISSIPSETSSNTAYLDFASGNTRIVSKGPDGTTLGGFQILQQASDSSPASTAFSIDTSSNATFAGDVTSNGNIISQTTSGNKGIKVITANDAEGFLIFGDAQDNSMGGMAYNNATNSLDIDCNNGVALSFNSSRNATFAGNVSLADDKKLNVGTGNDMSIFHNGSNSFIEQTGTGDLYIQQATDDKDIIFRCDDGSGGLTTYMYLDGSYVGTRFPQNVQLDDNVELRLGTNQDLRLEHTGSHGTITNFTGNLTIQNNTDDGDVIFKSDNGSGGTATYFKLDGSLVNGTTTLGAVNFPDKSKIFMGTGSDLAIYHDGSNSYIDDIGTGDLKIRGSNDIYLLDGSNNVMVEASASGSVDLYYNNNKKLETTNDGISVTGKIYLNDTSNPDGGSGAGEGGSLIVEGRRDGTANLISLRARDASAPTVALPNGQGGLIRWQGFDGSDFAQMGAIAVVADGQAVANNDAPSKMIFYTTADGGEALTTALTLDKSQNASFAGTISSGRQTITSASDNILTLDQTGGGWNYIEFESDSTRNFYVGQDSSENFVIGSDNSKDFYFTSFDEIRFGASDLLNTANILPNVDSTYTLGSTSLRWTNVYSDNINTGGGTFSGNVTLTKSVGDTELLIESDTDNNNENDNPRLHLRQDGGAISAYFGLNGDVNNTFTGALANSPYIRATGGIQFAPSNTLALTLDTSQNATFAGKVSAYGNSDTVPAIDIYSDSNHGMRILHRATEGDFSFERRVSGTNTEFLRIGRSTGNATFASALLPANNGTQALGGTSNRWDVGYFNKLRITNVVTNKILKFDGTDIDDSSITDTGSEVTFSTNATFSNDLTISGTFHPLSLLSKHYNTTNTSSSVTAGTSLDDEYELLTFGESASPLYLNIKTAAHNSASFVITRGYHGSNTASIQCTGSTYTANSGYANIRGLRVIKSGTAYKVIVRLYRAGSHVSFNLYARAWGSTQSNNIVFNTTLTDTFTESLALGEIADLSQSSSLSAAYSRDTLWADNAMAAFGNAKDLRLYHNSTTGNNNFENHTGGLFVTQYTNDGNIIFRSDDGSGGVAEYIVVDGGSGAVNLKHYGNTKFETTSTGVSVTGIIEATGYFSVEGTTGNTGTASDRWIGGDGTAGTWFYNVPTGSQHLFGINNSNVLTLNGTGATFAGKIFIPQSAGHLQGAGYPGTTYIGSTTNATTTYIQAGSTAKTEIELSGGDVNSNIIFKTPNSSNTTVTALTIDTNQNSTFAGNITAVRGFFNSGAISDIVSFANNNGSIVLGHTSNLASIDLGASKAIRIRQGSSVPLTLDGDGRLGLGVTNPTQKLDVFGTINIASDGTTSHTNSRLILNSTQSNGRGAGVFMHNTNDDQEWYAGVPYADGFDSYVIGHKSTASHTDSTSELANALLTVESSGNIGIGTNSAHDKLNLHGGATDNLGIHFNSNAAGSGGGTGFRVGMNASHSFMWNFRNTPLAFATGGTEKMTLTTSGNLGLGVTTPSKKIHIIGDGLIYGNLFLESTANGFRSVSMNTSDGSDNQTLSVCGGATASSARGGRISVLGNEVSSTGGSVNIVAGNVSTGDIKFLTANSDRMIINNSGRVGIGYTNPGSKLSVNGDGGFVSNSSSRVLYLTQHVANDGNIIQFLDQSGNNVWEVVGRNTAFYIYNNNVGQHSIYVNPSTNNVSIKKTTSSYALDVNGEIRASDDIIAFSDVRKKTNIKTIENSLNKVNKLRGVEFNKTSNNKKSIGVIAQEIEKIIPEVVHTDDNGYKSVAYGNITGLLIEAVKELNDKVQELENKCCNCK